jgi:hypothetical protein
MVTYSWINLRQRDELRGVKPDGVVGMVRALTRSRAASPFDVMPLPHREDHFRRHDKAWQTFHSAFASLSWRREPCLPALQNGRHCRAKRGVAWLAGPVGNQWAMPSLSLTRRADR